jgi:antirestriction protein ArdC
MASSTDVYESITNNIIQALELGVPPWEKPWFADGPINAVSGSAYRGVNYLNLLAVASTLDFKGEDLRFLTFNQARQKGWSVKKGAKAIAQVVFFSMIEEQLEEGNQDTQAKKTTSKTAFPFLRYSQVFHASQIDGIPEYVTQAKCLDFEPNVLAERIIVGSSALISTTGNKAYYSPTQDLIAIPAKKNFKSIEGYYGTLLHELAHWTGHKTRLDRSLFNTFGSELYAKEELRAELASVFLSAETGIEYQVGNHSAYIGSWIKALKSNKFEIKDAVSDAIKIVNYLLGLAKVESTLSA